MTACEYFDRGACRSCSWLELPYRTQVADLERIIAGQLAHVVPAAAWEPPVVGPPLEFRNKAKLVVAGRKGAPTLGILDSAGDGIDLQRCRLYEPALAASLPILSSVISDVGLTPYSVPHRTGELKHVILTVSPERDFMVRFVLRSEGQVPRIRESIDLFSQRLPGVRVVSANIHAQHSAIIEGDHEQVLTREASLPMRLNDVTLYLRPGSFFQTNTPLAERLYATARSWTTPLAVHTAWDLYCGVGGFALHLPVPHIVGVEASPPAVASARHSAAKLAERDDRTWTFVVDDAVAYARDNHSPDLAVVNPPRRGLGDELAALLNEGTAQFVLYSSCNPTTLAADLERLTSWQTVRAQIFDMFPQTPHTEVLVLLERR